MPRTPTRQATSSVSDLSAEAIPATATSVGVQESFADLEPLLSETTFVVVDLETTGTRAAGDEITEIGAVRVRGGVVEAELSTFVAIDGTLPGHISQLTGILPADLVNAPALGEVMATFLEFSRGAVLVAHNARFDLGFLRAAARSTGHEWPDPQSLCTLALARRILHSGETRGHRLSTLAAHLGSSVEPNHRALQDARATVDVLHALIARVGDCGVSTLSELKAYDGRLAPAVRRRATLTESLTDGPGVYVFRDSEECPSMSDPPFPYAGEPAPTSPVAIPGVVCRRWSVWRRPSTRCRVRIFSRPGASRSS
ncbi:exonuclease domain-containing protein [Dietzia aerolata]|uniref:exonuclease domain-containing protein n=1 Tax=Dietzia aerolata TaxID=595984 RepID=UPI00362D9741